MPLPADEIEQLLERLRALAATGAKILERLSELGVDEEEAQRRSSDA